ncbi:MAG: hypothetical protein Q4C87_08990 [Actinomycetaceae bacterium]|nr:hypothetical protein [Actinomycetaceae bacterium]
MTTQPAQLPQSNEVRTAWTMAAWLLIFLPVLELLVMVVDGAAGWEILIFFLRAAPFQVVIHLIIAICASRSQKFASERPIPRHLTWTMWAYLGFALLSAFIYPSIEEYRDFSVLTALGFSKGFAFSVAQGCVSLTVVLLLALLFIWCDDLDRAHKARQKQQREGSARGE